MDTPFSLVGSVATLATISTVTTGSIGAGTLANTAGGLGVVFIGNAGIGAVGVTCAGLFCAIAPIAIVGGTYLLGL